MMKLRRNGLSAIAVLAALTGNGCLGGGGIPPKPETHYPAES